MATINNPVILAVDVDETLVHWVGTKWEPMIKNIESLIRHKERGHYVIVWSKGGVGWSEKIVKELKLEKYVDLIMAKPTWILDDKEPTEWMERYWYGYNGETQGATDKVTSDNTDNKAVVGNNQRLYTLPTGALRDTNTVYFALTGQGVGSNQSGAV